MALDDASCGFSISNRVSLSLSLLSRINHSLRCLALFISARLTSGSSPENDFISADADVARPSCVIVVALSHD